MAVVVVLLKLIPATIAVHCQNNFLSPTNQSFKKKGASKSSSLVDLWESERESGVKAILQLVQLKVERLYDPPILEEEFIA